MHTSPSTHFLEVHLLEVFQPACLQTYLKNSTYSKRQKKLTSYRAPEQLNMFYVNMYIKIFLKMLDSSPGKKWSSPYGSYELCWVQVISLENCHLTRINV